MRSSVRLSRFFPCLKKHARYSSITYKFYLYCIPRYRDYSTAEKGLGFCNKFVLFLIFELINDQIVRLYCLDMVMSFEVIRKLHKIVVLKNSKDLICTVRPTSRKKGRSSSPPPSPTTLTKGWWWSYCTPL